MAAFGVLLTLFFLSGATALVYEVIWARMLALTFGSTVHALGVVLAAFMSGLSLGSFLLGRWADGRARNLLRLYAAMELGVAVAAALSPAALAGVDRLYVSLSPEGLSIWRAAGLRYLLAFLVLLVPTTLMGGTLPVLSAYAIRTERELVGRLGALYAVNTLGGAAGAALAGFLLIRTLGMQATVWGAAIVNLLTGVAAYAMGRRFAAAPAPTFADSPEASVSSGRGAAARYVRIAFFVSGAAAMAYEVAWTRLLVNVTGSTTFALSMILIGFLLGIALGSLAASRRGRPYGTGHFAALQIGIGVAGMATIGIFHLLPGLMVAVLGAAGDSYAAVLLAEFGMVIGFLLVPTTLMGATFPVAASRYGRGAGHRGADIGAIYAANTLGAIAGSVAAAFVFLPHAGSAATIKAAAALNLGAGAIGVAISGRPRLALTLAALLVLPLLPAGIPQRLLDSGAGIYGKDSPDMLEAKDHVYLYQREGLNATISVMAAQGGHIVFRTNGKADASIGHDMTTQLALAYFPAILHPAPRRVLVIGMGSGVTARAASEAAGPAGLTIVEIEPSALEAADFFSRVNGGIHRDPAVRVVLDDARAFLRTGPGPYDIVISEPSNPWISGIGNLFTREFYLDVRASLAKGGLFCQWVHLYALAPEDLRMIFRTFLSAFPEATLWHSGQGDVMLIGSLGPVTPFDHQAIGERLKTLPAHDLAAYLRIKDPLDFIAYHLAATGDIRAISAGARMNTDDLPLLEFSAPFSLYRNELSMPNNELLTRNLAVPPVSGVSPARGLPIEFLYRKLSRSMDIGIAVNSGWADTLLLSDPLDPDFLIQKARVLVLEDRGAEALALLGQALALSPDNADAGYETALLLKGSDPEAALRHLLRSIAARPESFDSLAEAAALEVRLGRPEAALKHLVLALRSPHPANKDAEILYSIGTILMFSGDAAVARGFFSRAAAASPADAADAALVLEAGPEGRRGACAFVRSLAPTPMFVNLEDEILAMERRHCD